MEKRTGTLKYTDDRELWNSINSDPSHLWPAGTWADPGEYKVIRVWVKKIC